MKEYKRRENWRKKNDGKWGFLHYIIYEIINATIMT